MRKRPSNGEMVKQLSEDLHYTAWDGVILSTHIKKFNKYADHIEEKLTSVESELKAAKEKNKAFHGSGDMTTYIDEIESMLAKERIKNTELAKVLKILTDTYISNRGTSSEFVTTISFGFSRPKCWEDAKQALTNSQETN